MFVIQVTSKLLPAWGSGQYEVVADTFTFHENAVWVADIHSTPVPNRTPNVINTEATSVLQNLVDIHVGVSSCHAVRAVSSLRCAPYVVVSH